MEVLTVLTTKVGYQRLWCGGWQGLSTTWGYASACCDGDKKQQCTWRWEEVGARDFYMLHLLSSDIVSGPLSYTQMIVFAHGGGKTCIATSQLGFSSKVKKCVCVCVYHDLGHGCVPHTRQKIMILTGNVVHRPSWSGLNTRLEFLFKEAERMWTNGTTVAVWPSNTPARRLTM